jgi:NADP-dependent 3-hydroxy acid dehydrogenase YdfG
MTDTELTNSISSPDIKAMVSQIVKMAISPYSIARAIAYVINEPDDVGVNEIVIRPTIQP